jgi:hypothetical protein
MQRPLDVHLKAKAYISFIMVVSKAHHTVA